MALLRFFWFWIWPKNINVNEDHPRNIPTKFCFMQTSSLREEDWNSRRLIVTWRVSLVKKELLTFPEHLSEPSVFSRVWVVHVFCAVFCRSLFVLFFFWPLYYLSFYLWLLITLWYRLAIVLSVLPFTASDYTFGVFWPLYYQSFHLRLLITPLVSFGHCIISPSIYGFWLHLWYLLATVLSVLPFTASDYTFGVFWPLYYQSFHLRLLITPLVSFGHCIISPSIYGF
jgi:hypothetical protein